MPSAAAILRDDLDPDFLKSVSVQLGWEYSDWYERLANDEYLSNVIRSEDFSRRRGVLATRALVNAAKRHRVPFNFRRLECNGQEKLLVKAGRVIIIQEPVLTRSDRPHTADYKVELANAHSLVRQLELELGDQPQRIYDWSGCILAVLLHAPAGPSFNAAHRSLGALMLAVPDARYESWTVRLDLHRVAMFGFAVEADRETQQEALVQEDNVIVTTKRQAVSTGLEE